MEQRLCEFSFTLRIRALATLRESWLRPPFTRACLEFLTTLTCRALYVKSHCHGQSCRFLALVFNHFDMQSTVRVSHCHSYCMPFVRACLKFLTTLTFRTPQESHIVSVPFETIEKNKKCFFYFFCISRTP